MWRKKNWRTDRRTDRPTDRPQREGVLGVRPPRLHCARGEDKEATGTGTCRTERWLLLLIDDALFVDIFRSSPWVVKSPRERPMPVCDRFDILVSTPSCILSTISLQRWVSTLKCIELTGDVLRSISFFLIPFLIIMEKTPNTPPPPPAEKLVRVPV